MVTQTASYYDIVTQLPADTVVTFHHVSWQEYEELLEQVGEVSGLHISFDDGMLQVMTLSPEHEKYVRFFESLMTVMRLRLRLNILSFGSVTMKTRQRQKGNEPDACFYVQTAGRVGNRVEIDFEVDPPPDIAVEIDVRHDSRNKFSIYAALGVPEIWRYDGQELTIYLLREGHYVTATQSQALPLLTSQVLTEFLTRLRQQGELQTLLAFEEWLQSRPQ